MLRSELLVDGGRLNMDTRDGIANDGVLRIGALKVHAGIDSIERNGEIIKLEPKAMRLLLCLAKHAGAVVSVEQLRDAGWEDSAVTHESVYQAVMGLRRTLNDDARNPTYIANVVRRGYRLIAPVSWGVAPPAFPAPPPSLGTPPSRQRLPLASRSRLVLALALVTVGCVIAGIVWRTAIHERAVPSVAVQDTSVAVLPFRDLSEKKDQEFFADGLTDEIINLLANVPSLRVPARTSSFYFKGKANNAQEVARMLGVSHLLEGSVRRTADNLRVTATLSRAADGYQVWSQTFEVGDNNIFSIQDDIAAGVVRNLKAIILPPSGHGAAWHTNIEAYTAILRARFLLSHESDSDNRDAIVALRRAIEIDPASAVAWAELARAHRDRASYFDETPDANMAAARAEAQKALQLDPNCAEAHDVLADIKLIYDYDPEGSIRENDASGTADSIERMHAAYPFYTGCVLGPCYEQVIRETDQDIANDPLNPGPYSTQALARYVFGELARAEDSARHAIALSPSSGYRRYLLVRILYARHDGAQLAEAIKMVPDSLYSRASLALAYQALGRTNEADRALKDMLTYDSTEGAYQIAEIYAARGEMNDALTWLERADALHDAGLWILQIDPLFRAIAEHPRFIALKRKLHMATQVERTMEAPLKPDLAGGAVAKGEAQRPTKTLAEGPRQRRNPWSI
jgi:TolB-like protein/DNA-binding winged helix-turn-helix (wHTH) protein/tetratricopeptide (TPR) repeat protein